MTRVIIYIGAVAIASGLSTLGFPWSLPLVLIASVSVGRLAAIDSERAA